MVETRKKNNPVWISEDQKEKIKEFNKHYWSDEIKEEQRNRMKEYYKKNPVSEETRKRLKEVNAGKNNGMFGKKHNEATKEKLKLAWIKRKNQMNNIDNNQLVDKI
jgi:hypothetical protein